MNKIYFNNDKEFVDLFKNLNKSLVVIEISTQPKLCKKSRVNKEPFEYIFKGNIICTSIRSVYVGYSYEELMNEKMESGEVFNSGSLPFGEYIKGSKSIIEYNGNYYLRIYYLDNKECSIEKIYHYADGKDLEDDELDRLNEFLPTSSHNSFVNNIKVSNIIGFKVNDNYYIRKGFR